MHVITMPVMTKRGDNNGDDCIGDDIKQVMYNTCRCVV